MKYKVGDKVRIKTWEEMEKEFGLNKNINISSSSWNFTKKMERELNNLNTDRVLTINKINNNYNYYKVKKMEWCWSDDMIECLAEDYYERFVSIRSRFEILDL